MKRVTRTKNFSYINIKKMIDNLKELGIYFTISISINSSFDFYYINTDDKCTLLNSWQDVYDRYLYLVNSK